MVLVLSGWLVGPTPAQTVLPNETSVAGDTAVSADVTIDEDPRAGSDLATRAILGRALVDDRSLGNAIDSLARIRRYAEAEMLLKQIDAKTPADRLTQIGSEISPAMRLRLQLSNRLSEAARQTLARMALAIQNDSIDPAKLIAAADVVSDDDASIERRNGALDRLIRGGDAGIAAAANRIIVNASSDGVRRLLRAMLNIDPDSPQSLIPAIYYGDANASARAAAALNRVDPTKYRLPLYVDAVRRGLASLSGEDAANLQAWLNLARDDAAIRTTRDDSLETVWIFESANGAATDSAIRPIQTTTRSARYKQLADVGSLLRILGLADFGDVEDTPSRFAIASVSTDLAYRIATDHDWGGPEDIDRFRQRWPQLYPRAMASVLDDALDRNDDVAALGAIRLLSRSVDPQPPLNVAVLKSLVRGTDHPRPAIRYEAALVADRIATEPYPGASRVLHRLSEMTRLKDQSTAILVENRREYRTAVQRVLADAGYDVVSVPTVDAAIERAARGGDIRLVLSRREPSGGETQLNDRLRRLPETAQTAIVFYNDPTSVGAAGDQFALDQFGSPIDGIAGIYVGTTPPPKPVVQERFGRSAGHIEFPASPSAFDSVRRRWRQRQPVPPMTALDRGTYRSAARASLN